jgi:NAD-reducing hydrogenase large subunit
VEQLTPTALKLRRLLHFGQTLQSHALHFFHLSSPDLLFGFGSDPAQRNIVGVLDKYPELALKGVKLRKYGQQIIEAIAGKRIHGTATVPGGMNKALTIAEREILLAGIKDILAWSSDAVALNEQIHTAHPEHHGFAAIRSNFLCMVGSGGELELYHGGLRASAANGASIFDQFDYRGYQSVIREEVRPWSYMKFPFLVELGKEQGWYRVGPLARVNNCDFISTPLAEAARKRFKGFAQGDFVHDTLAYHWARMIEALHCAESINELLHDPDITGTDLVATHGDKRAEGIGVIEAPRGTLFHHYQINEEGLITKANLIVSTTSNNQAMNESVRSVANEYLDGNEISEGLLNHLEVAVRAYDPCLSCATHALGKMPLQVELLNADGELLDRLTKNGSGEITHSV